MSSKNEVINFLRKNNITEGQFKYTTEEVYLAYTQWKKSKRLKRRKFTTEMSKIFTLHFDSKNSSRFFALSRLPEYYEKEE